MSEEIKKNIAEARKTIEGLDEADSDGDGHITSDELEMHLEFKRKELEDQDLQRDAMRYMTWFALFGMLLYPGAILITTLLGQDKAAQLIADIAPTYFVSISVLVAAYFGADAVKGKAAAKPKK